MAKKLNIAAPPLTRERLVDPHAGRPIMERLAEAGAVDLRDNAVVEWTSGGYARICPLDPNRRF